MKIDIYKNIDTLQQINDIDNLPNYTLENLEINDMTLVSADGLYEVATSYNTNTLGYSVSAIDANIRNNDIALNYLLGNLKEKKMRNSIYSTLNDFINVAKITIDIPSIRTVKHNLVMNDFNSTGELIDFEKTIYSNEELINKDVGEVCFVGGVNTSYMLIFKEHDTDLNNAMFFGVYSKYTSLLNTYPRMQYGGQYTMNNNVYYLKSDNSIGTSLVNLQTPTFLINKTSTATTNRIARAMCCDVQYKCLPFSGLKFKNIKYNKNAEPDTCNAEIYNNSLCVQSAHFDTESRRKFIYGLYRFVEYNASDTVINTTMQEIKQDFNIVISSLFTDEKDISIIKGICEFFKNKKTARRGNDTLTTYNAVTAQSSLFGGYIEPYDYEASTNALINEVRFTPYEESVMCNINMTKLNPYFTTKFNSADGVVCGINKHSNNALLTAEFKKISGVTNCDNINNTKILIKNFLGETSYKIDLNIDVISALNNASTYKFVLGVNSNNQFESYIESNDNTYFLNAYINGVSVANNYTFLFKTLGDGSRNTWGYATEHVGHALCNQYNFLNDNELAYLYFNQIELDTNSTSLTNLNFEITGKIKGL